jgi:hypothetical protein
VARAALLLWLLLFGSIAAAQPADEVPLADVLEILELDRQLLAIDLAALRERRLRSSVATKICSQRRLVDRLSLTSKNVSGSA